MKNTNLGQYSLKKFIGDFPQNPFLIYRIQDKLTSIKEGGIIGQAIANGARDNIRATVKMIVSQYRDNPRMITEIVGKETLAMIEELEEITLADDVKDIL